MVLTGCFVLPGDRAFLATVIGGVTSTNLTPASGCQDHTTSPSAFVPLSSLRQNKTGIFLQIDLDRFLLICRRAKTNTVIRSPDGANESAQSAAR
jgi:hypothetical protein